MPVGQAAEATEAVTAGNSEMEFWDQDGEAVVYCPDGQHLFSWDGRPVAYLQDEHVYDFAGRHIGWLTNGWIADNDGAALLFCDEARGGPIRPLKSLKSLKGLRELMPLKGLRELAPMKTWLGREWSAAKFW